MPKRPAPVQLAPAPAKARKRSDAEILAAWNAPGVEGFLAWLEDIKPRILTRSNKWEPVTLEPFQREYLEGALAVKPDGTFKHAIALHVTPRRHSKSTIHALVCLWMLTSRPHVTIQCLGNAGDHAERVMMRPVRGIIRATPALRGMVPETALQKLQIVNPINGSILQVSCNSMAQVFGDKLNLLWISDFHACPDVGPFDAFQASLLDSEGTLCLIDSNTDPDGGHVHALELQALQDEGIYCRRVEYPDLATYMSEAPAWIDRTKIERMRATTLPTAFDRDILGKRSSARNSLFPPEIIEVCRSPLPVPFPPERIPELTGGRKFVCGGGLDRSKSLFGGDNTVWTTSLKVAGLGDSEPEYFVLNQQVVVPNHSKFIKKAILDDHAKYKLDAVTLEAYEVADIKPWLDDQGIQNELVAAHLTNQNLSFVELYRIAKEGRLHFSEELTQLIHELSTFVYEEKRDGQYTFGHSSKKFHDDCVYSLNWSVFATRMTVLTQYSLPRLVCTNKNQRRSLCFLMGGDMELLCKHECRAFHEVSTMFQGFKRLRMDDDVTIAEFYTTRVRLEGAKVYQGV